MEIAAREIMTMQTESEPAPWTYWGFYVEAQTVGATVSMAKAGSPPTVSLEYSVNGGRTWSSFDADGGTTTVTLAAVGDRACFRAVTTNATLASSTTAYHKFVFGKNVAVGGNILSLLSSAEISAFPSTDSSASLCLSGLFYGATMLVDASALVLPDSAMPQYCYFSMFYGCTSLAAAPALPATTLADSCYYSMFNGCSKLTAAPALPATTLAITCYSQMFYGCSKLTAAPELPATKLASYCYRQMFYNCTRLRQITTAHTAWRPTSATTNWVNGVASSGTFTCPSALPQTRGTNNIPNNWTIVTT